MKYRSAIDTMFFRFDRVADDQEVHTREHGLTDLPNNLRRLCIEDVNLRRQVSAYGVAGRPRSPIASMLLKMPRAVDWSAYGA